MNTMPATYIASSCWIKDPRCFLPEWILSSNIGLSFEPESFHFPDSKSLQEVLEMSFVFTIDLLSSNCLVTACKKILFITAF